MKNVSLRLYYHPVICDSTRIDPRRDELGHVGISILVENACVITECSAAVGLTLTGSADVDGGTGCNADQKCGESVAE